MTEAAQCLTGQLWPVLNHRWRFMHWSKRPTNPSRAASLCHPGTALLQRNKMVVRHTLLHRSQFRGRCGRVEIWVLQPQWLTVNSSFSLAHCDRQGLNMRTNDVATVRSRSERGSWWCHHRNRSRPVAIWDERPSVLLRLLILWRLDILKIPSAAEKLHSAEWAHGNFFWHVLHR